MKLCFSSFSGVIRLVPSNWSICFSRSTNTSRSNFSAFLSIEMSWWLFWIYRELRQRSALSPLPCGMYTKLCFPFSSWIIICRTYAQQVFHRSHPVSPCVFCLDPRPSGILFRGLSKRCVLLAVSLIQANLDKQERKRSVKSNTKATLTPLWASERTGQA